MSDTTHGKQPPSSTRIHAKVPIEVTAMDSNIDENHSVIMKTDKIDPVQFLWFTNNRLVTIFKIQIFIF
jgi:hypothetical protein